MTTDGRAPVFISYRHAQEASARRLVEALREVGVPVWFDRDDLGAARTERTIRELIARGTLSGAILLLTPDVAGSDFIARIELPRLLEKDRADDDFWVLPVAAGGLTPLDAPTRATDDRGAQDDLAARNILPTTKDFTASDAATIARAALRERLSVIHRRSASEQPLNLRLFTRAVVASPDADLRIDWRHHWPANEPPSPDTWNDRLLPALDTVRDVITEQTGRPIDAAGLPAIPAAVALGVAFAAPRTLPLRWQQHSPGYVAQTWSLHAASDSRAAKRAGWQLDLQHGHALTSTAVAVVVNVTHDGRAAAAANPSVPPLRGTIVVDHADAIAARARDEERPDWIHLDGAEQAASLAYLVRAAVSRARQNYDQVETVHLFFAGPAGLAVLIGQLMNTVRRLHTYEHRGTDYLPAAILRP